MPTRSWRTLSRRMRGRRRGTLLDSNDGSRRRPDNRAHGGSRLRRRPFAEADGTRVAQSAAAGPAIARVPRNRPDGDGADARAYRPAAEAAPVPAIRAPLHLLDRRLHRDPWRPKRQEQDAADATR